MNLTIKSFILAGTLCVTAAGMTTQAADLETVKKNGVLRVAVANEIPYGYMDLDGQARGAGPDVAKQIAKALGIEKIEWVTTNFGSLIPGLQADRFDMVAAEMAVLPQRCQQIIYSEPNSSYGEGLLVPTGNPKNIHDFESFATSGLKVAIMAGADQLEMLQAMNVPEAQIVTLASNSDAISTVSTGRADAYAATSLTVGGLAAKSDKVQAAEDFVDPVVDGEVVRSWGAFAFSKNSESLRDAVNEVLIDFKKTPAWKEILTGYGFSDEDVSESFERTTAQLCEQ